MSDKDGGPAFPAHALSVPYEVVAEPTSVGMSLRDWFAGMALQGLCVDEVHLHSRPTSTADQIAAKAYAYADAMLKERTK